MHLFFSSETILLDLLDSARAPILTQTFREQDESNIIMVIIIIIYSERKGLRWRRLCRRAGRGRKRLNVF